MEYYASRAQIEQMQKNGNQYVLDAICSHNDRALATFETINVVPTKKEVRFKWWLYNNKHGLVGQESVYTQLKQNGLIPTDVVLSKILSNTYIARGFTPQTIYDKLKSIIQFDTFLSGALDVLSSSETKYTIYFLQGIFDRIYEKPQIALVDSQCEDIEILVADNVPLRFWSGFFYVVVHHIMWGLFENGYQPYNDDNSYRKYEVALDQMYSVVAEYINAQSSHAKVGSPWDGNLGEEPQMILDRFGVGGYMDLNGWAVKSFFEAQSQECREQVISILLPPLLEESEKMGVDSGFMGRYADALVYLSGDDCKSISYIIEEMLFSMKKYCADVIIPKMEEYIQNHRGDGIEGL